MTTALAPPTRSQRTPAPLIQPAEGEPTWSKLVPRILLLLVLAAAGALGMSQLATPTVVPSTAPATQFSAGRAMQDVNVIARAPHPMGTAAHAAVERYLTSRLRAIGLRPQIETITATMVAKSGAIWAGRAHNIVARIPGTADTGAVLVAGHYDSVPTGPAAADCGTCAATVLETARALKSGPPLKNDVILLLTDAEEHDTLGAKGFMDQHPWAKDIKFALNVDSMGNHGPAMAYFGSLPNQWIMSHYFAAAPYPLSYSFLMDPFSRIRFGMDLTRYIRDGAMGIEAANFRNPQAYHSALDNPSALDPGTLQHEGSNVLALTRHFGNLNLGRPGSGGDAAFFNVTATYGILYSASWALGIGFLVLLLFIGVLVLGFRRNRLTVRGLLAGLSIFVGAFVASLIAMGSVWWVLKQATPDYQVFMQDAPYNNDLHLLAFIALAVAVVASVYTAARRRVSAPDLALGALGLSVVLTLVTSAFLPGMSYLFCWPTLAGLLVLGWSIAAPKQVSNPWVLAGLLAVPGAVALTLAIPVLNLLFEFLGRAQLVSPLPLVTAAFVPVILLLAVFLPHLEFLGGTRRWLIPMVALVVSAGFFATARATSAFDATRPRPDGVAYVLNGDTGKAAWVSVGAKLDNWTRQFFPHAAQKTSFVVMPSEAPDLSLPALEARAPNPGILTPRVTVLSDRSSGTVRHLDLRLASPRHAPNIEIKVNTAARITAVSVDGRAVKLNANGSGPSGNLRLEYYGLPRSGARLTLQTTLGHGIQLGVTDRSNGLPIIPGTKISPRPRNTMPALFEMRDPTIVTKTFWLPA